MKKHIHGHILLLAFAITVTAIVVVLYVYVEYAISNSVARTATARQEVKEEQSRSEHEQDLVRLYSSTVVDRARLRTFFLPADRVVDFIESLEGLGPQAGSDVVLSNVAADDLSSAAPGTLGSARAHVRVVGSWQAVMRTLSLAETTPYNSTIDKIRLDSSVTTEKVPKREWRLEFDIKAATIASSTAHTHI